MKKLFNKPIGMLLVTNGLILIAGAMLGPIYALFVERIGGDFLDASYAFGAYAFAAGITTLISGEFLAIFFEFNTMFIVMGLISFSSAFYIFRLPRIVL